MNILYFTYIVLQKGDKGNTTATGGILLVWFEFVCPLRGKRRRKSIQNYSEWSPLFYDKTFLSRWECSALGMSTCTSTGQESSINGLMNLNSTKHWWEIWDWHVTPLSTTTVIQTPTKGISFRRMLLNVILNKAGLTKDFATFLWFCDCSNKLLLSILRILNQSIICCKPINTWFKVQKEKLEELDAEDASAANKSSFLLLICMLQIPLKYISNKRLLKKNYFRHVQRQGVTLTLFGSIL